MSELATRTSSHLQVAPTVTRDRMDLLKRTIAGDIKPPLTDHELELFAEVANRKGLDPFARQIHVTKRQGKLIIQTGIDGFRLIAERTGRYDGQDGPWWCGEDGQWRDVWPSNDPPMAAKVIVYRSDSGRGFTGIAHWREYAQYTTDNDGRRLNRMWETMKAGQLAKCAEALALRKGFPQDLSGIYTTDEIVYEESPGPIQVTTAPAGPGANTSVTTIPTLDQIKRIRTPEAADKLIKQAGPEFAELAGRAVLAITGDEIRTRDQARDWWTLASVKDRREVLEYAVELHEQQQYEMSPASPAPPATTGDNKVDPAPSGEGGAGSDQPTLDGEP